MTTKARPARVKGDTFILATFPISFLGRPLVLDSGNTPEEVFANIAEHLDDERLSFCRVGYWTAPDKDDPSDMVAHDVTTIFEIQPYETDALELDLDDLS